MFGRTTRIVFNALGIVGLVWLGYVIYGSFTDRGLWHAVADLLASPDGRYSPAGTFAICALIGLVPLIALGAALWFAFLRHRDRG